MDDRHLWRILIVDDDEDEYFLTRAMLNQAQGRKIELTWAATYEAGQKFLSTGRYDAVLIDYDLGSRTGIDLIRETVAGGYPAPLILYTGRGSYEVDLEAMHAGATLYLTKAEANPLLLERIIRYAIERKQMEETLRRERELLAKVIDNAPVGVAVVEGAELRYVLANPAFHNIQPDPTIDMKGRILAEVLPQLALDGADKYIRDVLLSGKPNSLPSYAFPNEPGQKPSWWDLDHLPLYDIDGKVRRVLILANNITGQMESRQQVEAEKSLLDAILEQLPTAVFICEAPSGKVIKVNEKAKELFGDSLTIAEDIARYVEYQAIHPDGRPYRAEEYPMARSIRSGEIVKNEEITHLFKDGTVKTMVTSTTPVFNHQGAIVAGVLICDDISEIKQLEERLSYQALALKNVHDALVVTDTASCIIAWNKAAEDLYGWTSAEALGKNENEIFQTEYDEEAQANTKEWITRNGVLTFETTHYAKNGQPLIVEGTITPIMVTEDQISGYIYAIHDITAHKQAEEKLYQREQRIAEILDSISDSFFALDRSWNFTYINARAARAGGAAPEDLLGKNIWETWPWLLGTETEKCYRQAMDEKIPSRFESPSQDSTTWFETNVYPSKEGISVYWLDITDRKKLQDRLAYQAHMLQNMQDAIIVGDTKHRIRLWNRAAEKLYGWSAKEVHGQVVPKLLRSEISEEERTEIFKRLDEAGSVTVEIAQYTKGGRRIIVESRLFSLADNNGNIVRYVAANHDITDRKKVEEELHKTLAALHQSQWHLQLAHEAAGLGSWQWKFGDTFTTCSEIFFRIHGLEPAPDRRLELDRYLSLIHPEDQARVTELTYTAISGTPYGEIEDNEFRIILPDGSVRWMAAYQKAILDEDQVLGITGVTSDITHQKQAEEAARRSEQFIRDVFNHLFVYVGVLNPSGELLEINQAPLDQAGLNRSEVLNKPFQDTYWWSYSPEAQAQLCSAIERAASGETIRYDVMMQTAGGNLIPVDFMIAPMYDEHGQIRYLIPSGVDISDRKRAEEALKHYARQLERSNRDLEEFAFVASHDLQEPARKIKAFSQSLINDALEKLDDNEADILQRMNRSSERMTVLLSDLLAYSRLSAESESYTQVNLMQVLDEVISDLDVRLEKTGGKVVCNGKLPQIEAAPTQIRRLLLNLIGNALKFHREGVPPLVQVSSQRISGTHIQIEIEDNGIGFDEKNLELIFQPFKRLVKRSAYEGSGIGLPICRRIVEHHGGSLTARSTPGQGSTFTITLPVQQ